MTSLIESSFTGTNMTTSILSCFAGLCQTRMRRAWLTSRTYGTGRLGVCTSSMSHLHWGKSSIVCFVYRTTTTTKLLCLSWDDQFQNVGTSRSHDVSEPPGWSAGVSVMGPVVGVVLLDRTFRSTAEGNRPVALRTWESLYHSSAGEKRRLPPGREAPSATEPLSPQQSPRLHLFCLL